jgi:hypothetical protein
VDAEHQQHGCRLWMGHNNLVAKFNFHDPLPSGCWRSAIKTTNDGLSWTSQVGPRRAKGRQHRHKRRSDACSIFTFSNHDAESSHFKRLQLAKVCPHDGPSNASERRYVTANCPCYVSGRFLGLWDPPFGSFARRATIDHPTPIYSGGNAPMFRAHGVRLARKRGAAASASPNRKSP